MLQEKSDHEIPQGCSRLFWAWFVLKYLDVGPSVVEKRVKAVKRWYFQVSLNILKSKWRSEAVVCNSDWPSKKVVMWDRSRKSNPPADYHGVARFSQMFQPSKMHLVPEKLGCSPIFFWSFHIINHPAIEVPDYGNPHPPVFFSARHTTGGAGIPRIAWLRPCRLPCCPPGARQNPVGNAQGHAQGGKKRWVFHGISRQKFGIYPLVS